MLMCVKRRRRIAMIISRYFPITGGTERQCAQLAKALLERGERVWVITETFDSRLAGVHRVAGVPVIRLRGSRWKWLSWPLFFLRAWRAARQLQPAIVHAHMIALPAMVAVRAKRHGIPALVKTAGARATGDFGTSRQSAIGRLKLRLLKRSRVPVVCPSPELLREAQSVLGQDYPLHAIPNGVDGHYFSTVSHEAKTTLRRRLQWEREGLYAIYAGRMAPGKGVDILLRHWPAASPWQLILCLADDTKASGEIAHLGERVTAHYNLIDLRPYYQASDLAILMSEGEGLSNFLLEAMACGLPTVTTAAAALGESLDRDVFSWTIDENALPATLAMIGAQRSTLATKGTAARAYVESHFSIEQTADRYQTLYRQLEGDH
jgi:glycosyltransferase involved in cell wall biosynthesis